jgi:RecA/RadA recombinase
MSENVENQLKAVFDALLEREFSGSRPPEPYITPTGIKHLDAILGGGTGSSLPIMLSSAPEVGKSSIAVFLAKQFLDRNENSLVAYVDVETASAGTSANSGIKSRVKNMNIPENRFQYVPMLLDVKGVHDVVKKYADMKKEMEDKLEAGGKPEEINVLIIIDSLASCPSSKTLTAEDPKEFIGLKARELGHALDKLKPVLAFSKITLILIDQVRANMQIAAGPFAKQDEKGVGVWNNIKSSSSSSVLQHNLKQWLYISKKKELYPGSDLNVDGWILDVKTEKNKLCSSGYSVSLVFDKHETIHKIYSEYLFMKEMTSTENKYTGRKKDKLPYPLVIKDAGAYKYIDCINPETGKSEGKSSSFYEKDLVAKYNGDPEFREIFDWAITTSVEERINKFLLKHTTPPIVVDKEDE